jgi:hypothetical protein
MKLLFTILKIFWLTLVLGRKLHYLLTFLVHLRLQLLQQCQNFSFVETLTYCKKQTSIKA